MTARRTQAERREATRAALLEAARPLFAERGYEAVSSEEIVAAAGVTRGALYHHFDGKRGLFAAVFEEVEARADGRASTSPGSTPATRSASCSPPSTSSSTSASTRRPSGSS